MSFPAVSLPKLSPSLNEYDLPTFVDDQGNVLALLAAVQPNSNGVTGLVSSHVAAEPVSQVTGKRQLPQVGTNKIPTIALMGVNASTGALVPFVASSAVSVSGKFQSTVVTATGSAQSIAHGLGVIPSVVHVSIYDNTDAGVLATGYVITEGTHTTSNIVVTVTANAKFKVIAFV